MSFEFEQKLYKVLIFGFLQGITVMLSLIEVKCRPLLNGMELWEDLQRNKQTLSSGDNR